MQAHDMPVRDRKVHGRLAHDRSVRGTKGRGSLR